MAGDWDGDVDRRRALLRQLRDLDDDLAAGKLTEEDHRRLREPIEHEAANSLTRRSSRTATATRRRAGDPDHRPGGTADSDAPPADSDDSDADRRCWRGPVAGGAGSRRGARDDRGAPAEADGDGAPRSTNGDGRGPGGSCWPCSRSPPWPG